MQTNRITVIGAGVMGKGIAYVSSLAGFDTVIMDVDEKMADRSYGDIKKLFDKGVGRNKISMTDREDALGRLRVSVSYEEAIKDCDLVIEAVPEVAEIKRAVHEAVSEKAMSHTIFASNTSTMSPTEIASYGNRPESSIAMHFFNPVHRMPLVEIVRGLETSDATVTEVEAVAKKMGKETVVINEFPGFVTSRMSCLIGNEAFHMLQEGLGTPADIDKAVRLGLNHPMGPFELVDLVGLDARLNNMKELHSKLGERFRPAPLLEKYVKAGRLGKKSGRGIYDYSE